MSFSEITAERRQLSLVATKLSKGVGNGGGTTTLNSSGHRWQHSAIRHTTTFAAPSTTCLIIKLDTTKMYFMQRTE